MDRPPPVQKAQAAAARRQPWTMPGTCSPAQFPPRELVTRFAFPVGLFQLDLAPARVRLVAKARGGHDPKRIGERDQFARPDRTLL